MFDKFENFNNNYFEEELSSKLDLKSKDCTTLKNNFANVLNKQARKMT